MIPSTNKQPVKYREVERALRQEIAAGRWNGGDQLPGEYDIARTYNVSYLTVRQAVATLVNDGTLFRVRGKGTFVVDKASSEPIATTRHQMALLFPTNWMRRDPYYFPDILQGFQYVMDKGGHHVSLLNDNIADAPGGLPPGSAVACLLVDDAHVQLVERLRDSGHRVLGINRYTGRRSIPSVRIDDQHGVELAVDFLVSLGHERISFLRGPEGNLDATDRRDGFRSAVARHNLQITNEAGDDFGEAAGHDAAQELLALSNRPTALICASDLAAIGAIRAAEDLGFSVPRDLSVVGFGDFSVAHYVRPSLTTIRQSRVALGRTAGERLIRLAKGEDVTDVVLPAELIVRESTAARA